MHSDDHTIFCEDSVKNDTPLEYPPTSEEAEAVVAPKAYTKKLDRESSKFVKKYSNKVKPNVIRRINMGKR